MRRVSVVAEPPQLQPARNHMGLRGAMLFLLQAALILGPALRIAAIGEEQGVNDGGDRGGEEEGMKMTLPIGVHYDESHGDLVWRLCTLDYMRYRRHPERYPTLSHLSEAYCKDNEEQHATLSELLRKIGRPLGGGWEEPTGLIFHGHASEGSSVLTNLLASASCNLVFAQPAVFMAALDACVGCSDERMVEVMRGLFHIVVRSTDMETSHDFTFVSFHPDLVSRYMHLVIRAFPTTPWIYLYRAPVDAIAWSLQRDDGGRGMGPSCLRSKEDPPAQVQRILNKLGHGGGGAEASSIVAAVLKDEEFCAAYLESANSMAVEMLMQYPEHGRAVEYTDDLLVLFLDTLLPGHFRAALSESEIAELRAKATQLAAVHHDRQQWPNHTTSSEVAAQRFLAGSFTALQAESRRDMNEVEHVAWLKRQESYVFSRAGSRFFDTPNCPDVPERPQLYKVLDILNHWQPDDMSLPSRHYNSLCRFDYQTEFHKVMAYRDAEVPFVMYNIPEIKRARDKWSAPGYLNGHLGDTERHVEIGETSHFQYYHEHIAVKMPNYTRPTRPDNWPWHKWHAWAQAHLDIGKDEEHVYMRTTDVPVYRQDLPILTPAGGLHANPEQQCLIDCRFGVRRTIIDAHYDTGRNWVAQVVGMRRWILAPPESCYNTYLLPDHQPSERHSRLDWAQPPIDLDRWPRFKKVVGTEVIITEGDMMYVPAFWLHLISTLGDVSYQCNTVGATSSVGLKHLLACGFYDDTRLETVLEFELRHVIRQRKRERMLRRRQENREQRLAGNK